jgi:hypothetical protein
MWFYYLNPSGNSMYHHFLVQKPDFCPTIYVYGLYDSHNK